MYILYGTWMCWSLIRMRSWQRSGKLASTEALLLEGKSPCWCCERSVQKGWINTLLNIVAGTWSLFCHFYVVTWTWYPNLSIYVPGSVAPPMVPRPFPQFVFHLHAICSISEPQPFTCNLCAAFQSRILPTKYLGATYVLPACCLHITSIYLYIYIHTCIFPTCIRPIAYL